MRRPVRLVLLPAVLCSLAVAVAAPPATPPATTPATHPDVFDEPVAPPPASTIVPPPPQADAAPEPQPADPAPAPEPPPAPEKPGVTKVYDVRDLITPVPRYTPPWLIAAEMSVHGGGLFANDGQGREERGTPTREQMIERLVKTITETIQPDSWREAGGSTGAMSQLDDRLIVTHTADAHAQVTDLLAQLRRETPGTVRVRAHWVRTRRPALAKALHRPPGAGETSALVEADPAALEDVAPDATHYRGEILCTDGQPVYLLGVLRQEYVAGVESVVAESAVAHNPTLATASGGLILAVTASVAPDRSAATVTLASQYADPRPGPPVPIVSSPTTRPTTGPTSRPAMPASSTQRVDLPQIEQMGLNAQELATTARIPLGRTVLIGGVTLDATTAPPAARPPAGSAPDPEPPQLYLFLEVTAN